MFRRLIPKKIKIYLKHAFPNLVKNVSIINFNRSKNVFLSFDDAVVLCDQWIKKIPRDVDLIVGIPRSGLLIANIIALKLGKPLAEPHDVSNFWLSEKLNRPTKISRLLLIDDSYRSGETMNHAIDVLMNQGISRESILTGALITKKAGLNVLDTFAKRIDGYRFFEWNMVHKKMKLATDMDGVLCEEPPENTYYNEQNYKKWISSARPFIIPQFEIECILTSRIENYREETVEWLKAHKVMYKELIMGSAQSREDQKKTGLYHKIVALKKVKPEIYWESSIKDATIIKQSVQIPVLVLDQKIILN